MKYNIILSRVRKDFMLERGREREGEIKGREGGRENTWQEKIRGSEKDGERGRGREIVERVLENNYR